jgi:hypothetical protein
MNSTGCPRAGSCDAVMIHVESCGNADAMF